MAKAKQMLQLQSGTVTPIPLQLVASKVSYKYISKHFQIDFQIDITLFVLSVQIMQYKEATKQTLLARSYLWHVNMPFLAV